MKSENMDSADLDLGSLGKGVLVTLSESVLCGTGGCPIYAYVREENAYRKILGDKKRWVLGWAFAVVKSKATIPDLVIVSNLSGGVIVLTLYRYSGKPLAPLSRWPQSWLIRRRSLGKPKCGAIG